MAEQSPVDPPASGILGMNDKLGILKKPIKKVPFRRPGFGTVPPLPQLPDIALQQRKSNNEIAPGGADNPITGPGSPIDKMKNKVARGRLGGRKEII